MSGGHARAGAACPACASAAAGPIFALRGIPVHAILTLRTRASADAFPTGDLDLLACPACGLIWNPLFAPSTQRFGPDYEETQAFSTRFQAFQASMASRLIARHGCAESASSRSAVARAISSASSADSATIPASALTPPGSLVAIPCRAPISSRRAMARSTPD